MKGGMDVQGLLQTVEYWLLRTTYCDQYSNICAWGFIPSGGGKSDMFQYTLVLSSMYNYRVYANRTQAKK